MNLILTRMVQQFEARHKVLPKKIVIDPVALVILTHRRSVAPKWKGIPVVCQEIPHNQPKSNTIPETLGVIAMDNDLRALDVFTS